MSKATAQPQGLSPTSLANQLASQLRRVVPNLAKCLRTKSIVKDRRVCGVDIPAGGMSNLANGDIAVSRLP